MNFIQGQSREQMVLIPDCLDSLIDAENEIRLIDLFVDSLNIADYSFTIKKTIEGRPAYHPKDLLNFLFMATSKFLMMIFYKKTLSYFKRAKLIRISRDIFIIVFVCFLLLYINDKYNQTRVYENLSTVEGGDDIQIAIKKMKRNTIWLPYSICLAPYEHGDSIYQVEFHSRGSHLDYYGDPQIFYNKKTNKVIRIDSRLRPVF